MLRSLLVVSIVLAAGPAAADRATWINPLDVDYKYNFEQTHDHVSYRTGADSVIVLHKDAYYLMLTLADGFWRSLDLVTWEFIPAVRWPFDGNVAPAAISDGNKLYLLQAGMEPRPLLSSTDPSKGQFEFEERIMQRLPNSVPDELMAPGKIPPGPWDPALFRDDDGRWYLYWGSSNTWPMYGIELDPRKHWEYVGEARPLLTLHPDQHGWERFGRDHREENTKPFMEGAWMIKHDGRYYLQYAAPGTEYNVYANGVYVSDHPLGPFTYAPYNPVSYKPGGFAAGAGHGCMFADRHGNWWNTGTPWFYVNWGMERRTSMFPAGFDADGQMYASTRFGDFPHWAATSRWQDPDELFTGWMLLSYRKPATASSTLGAFAAANVTDEDPRTFWVAGANRTGETLTVDLGADMTVRAIQVNYADYKSERYRDSPDIWTAFDVLGSRDGKSWSVLAQVTDKPGQRRDRPNAYLPLAAPARVRYVRYKHGYVGAANLAISDLRVFGNADGKPPGTPASVTATRSADPRNAMIKWGPVPGAIGYNVRWGLRPDRLHETYQVWANSTPRTTLELRALTVGQSYAVAVEAFNDVGVSMLSTAADLK